MSKIKTPRQKKQLSLTRDHRAPTAGSAKTKRTNSAAEKRRSHQQERHAVDQVLHKLGAEPDEDQLIDAELAAKITGRLTQGRGVKKPPDIPLKKAVQIRAQRRSAEVEQYIVEQAPDARKALHAIRKAIRKAVPEALETISYKIPTFVLDGRVVLHVAAWKKHISVYPANAELRRTFATELEAYDLEKSTIRFPLDEPMPLEFIARLALFRARG